MNKNTKVEFYVKVCIKCIYSKSLGILQPKIIFQIKKYIFTFIWLNVLSIRNNTFTFGSKLWGKEVFTDIKYS